MSAAEVAEISYATFTSKPKAQHVTARSIVRRIPELNTAKLAGQDPPGSLCSATTRSSPKTPPT